MPFGAFRYVAFANLICDSQGSGTWDPADFANMPRAPTAAFWHAIADYPWTSAFYKDLGDSYVAAFNTPDAWLGYDPGRAVDPDWAAGPISAIAALEARIRADQPDMFERDPDAQNGAF